MGLGEWAMEDGVRINNEEQYKKLKTVELVMPITKITLEFSLFTGITSFSGLYISWQIDDNYQMTELKLLPSNLATFQ